MNETYSIYGASYEAACVALNLDPIAELPFKGDELTGRQKCSNAHTKLMIINEAMHIGFEGDKDYEPYFIKNSSGLGFSYGGYDRWSTDSSVGARLKYGSYDRMKFAVKQHEAIYNDLLSE